jgi:hypothetical protein
MPFSSFPTDYFMLPDVSFVVPDLKHDMHTPDGTIQDADLWLEQNFSDYADWAMANNGLLIITWDTDDGTEGNRIPTLLLGGNVFPGVYSEPITHFSLFRTLEVMYGLDSLVSVASEATDVPESIQDIWVQYFDSLYEPCLGDVRPDDTCQQIKGVVQQTDSQFARELICIRNPRASSSEPLDCSKAPKWTGPKPPGCK